ncbi:MAG: hypothetical protein JXR91_15875 [Deltaproteobacteria bacterium]|nr:hypothetical protein [Deltaproteobacteria bacterium]
MKVRFRKFLFQLIGVCIFFSSAVVSAQYEDDDFAKSAFIEGTKLFSEGKFNDASIAFKAAYNLKKTWKLLYNIAQAEAASKRYGSALENFEKYLAEGGDEIDRERRDEVIDEIEALRNMIGDITFKGEKGLMIYIDDIKRGTLPLPGSIPVSGGILHSVEIKDISNKIRFKKDVLLRSSQTLLIDVSNNKPGKLFSGKLNLAGMGLTLSGGALLISSAVTGSIALVQQKKLDKDCPDAVCVDISLKDIQKKRDNLALAADILLISGSALVISGGIMLLINRARKKKTSVVSFNPVILSDSRSVYSGFFVKAFF